MSASEITKWQHQSQLSKRVLLSTALSSNQVKLVIVLTGRLDWSAVVACYGVSGRLWSVVIATSSTCQETT